MNIRQSVGTLFAAFCFGISAQASEKYNVLFIAVDDLRPELGCYGQKRVKSPNIDQLARRGLVFDRAYVQQAVCSPSRTSLLTGRRPDTTKIYDLETHFRDTIPDVITLPQHFKQNGYEVHGLSKIYHGSLDDAQSWSVPHWTPNVPPYGPEGEKVFAEVKATTRPAGKNVKIKGLPWEAPKVEDNQLPDGQTADEAIKRLQQLKDKPFFLAVGFIKPHLPFVAPRKYWDLYDRKDIELAPNPFPPKGVPNYALTDWGELRGYVGIPKTGPLGPEQAREAKHGYYAAVSYMDAQVGRLLKELDRLKLRDKTIVVFWGDHGWQLGEHGLWCKHTNFEIATRSTLIVSAPRQKSTGKKTDGLVEFVDIYPTLVDLCKLPEPTGLEGTSFSPLLTNPKLHWKTAAFSQYPRNVAGLGKGMGYTMRTDRYRLTEWSIPGKDFVEYELYDHQKDPQENVNLAKDPEFASRVKELAGMLKAGWRAATPR